MDADSKWKMLRQCQYVPSQLLARRQAVLDHVPGLESHILMLGQEFQYRYQRYSSGPQKIPCRRDRVHRCAQCARTIEDDSRECFGSQFLDVATSQESDNSGYELKTEQDG